MEKIWYIFKDDHHLGPFSVEEIMRKYEKGEVSEAIPVWKEGQERWIKLMDCPDFEQIMGPPDLPLAFEDELPPPLPPLPEDEDATREIQIPLPQKKTKEVEVEAEEQQEESSKRPPVWGKVLASLSISIVVLVSLYFIFEKMVSAPPKFIGLQSTDERKLEEVVLARPTPNPRMALALTRNGQSVWLSSNRHDKMKLYLTLSSFEGRTLNGQKVELTASGIMENGAVQFKDLKIEQGEQFSPGEYRFQVTGVALGLKAKILNWLQKFKFLQRLSLIKNWNPKVNFSGSTLLNVGSISDFNKKLEASNAERLKEKLDPLKERLENYRTMISLSQKMEKLFFGVLYKIKTGKYIRKFEQEYSVQIGPMLRDLTVNNNEKMKALQDDSAVLARGYQELIDYAKELGEIASDMVTQTAYRRLVGPITRRHLSGVFKPRLKTFRSKGLIRIQKLEKEMAKIQAP